MYKRKESQNYRMTSIMVKPDTYDKFIDLLPRRKSVGEALREYMESVVEENEKKKKVDPPTKGAINYIVVKSNKDLHNKQLMLDLWQHCVNDDRDKIANTFTELTRRDQNQFVSFLRYGLELCQRMK